MTNILADRDRLRAEFILSMQRLENSVERMKIQAAKKGDAIKRLKVELGEKTTAISVLEARKKPRRDQSCVRKAESKRSRLIPKLRNLDSCCPILCADGHVVNMSQIRHLDERYKPAATPQVGRG